MNMQLRLPEVLCPQQAEHQEFIGTQDAEKDEFGVQAIAVLHAGKATILKGEVSEATMQAHLKNGDDLMLILAHEQSGVTVIDESVLITSSDQKRQNTLKALSGNGEFLKRYEQLCADILSAYQE